MPELYAHRLKLGVVVPSTNTTLEPDCHDLRIAGVTAHTARIPVLERKISGAQAYAEHVRAMREGIDDAVRRVMSCAPGQLVMGVALEAFWGGLAGSQKLLADLESLAGVPVSLGSFALDAALKELAVTRISVLTPHMPAGDEQVRGWFEEAGYEITGFVGLECTSPRLIAEVPLQRLREAVATLNVPRAQAIVQVGTNLQFKQVAAAAETMLGKPVLAINAAMWWHSLRGNGIEDRIDGFGQLLRDH